MHLAMSPDAFQSIALTWITVITLVIAAFIAAVVKLLPQIKELKDLFKENVLQQKRLLQKLDRPSIRGR